MCSLWYVQMREYVNVNVMMKCIADLSCIMYEKM